MIGAGQMARRIQFQRAAVEDDGMANSEKWFEDERDNLGQPVWAKKTDVSDAERLRAGEVQASLTARFIVRWSAFTSDLTPKDRIKYDGKRFRIFAIKEIGRREGLEITAGARVDQ
jgi:SPP1 family predicted phage head-tail adaptor